MGKEELLKSINRTMVAIMVGFLLGLTLTRVAVAERSTLKLHIHLEGSDDAGDGSRSKPYRTLTATQPQLHAHARNVDVDVELAFGPGVHSLVPTNGLQLGAGSSNVVVSGAGAGATVLSGAQVLSGWEVADTHLGGVASSTVWRTKVPDPSLIPNNGMYAVSELYCKLNA